ncbi:hypothetical protein FZC78_06820 [Rossellomorea vietnamensis]|jgi:hypothetical protein|uniref:Uncharacterized protein n=1 Tax=Rossellomorea vietnamensis TaxID=218284 RepID=A0A5D4NVV3_9BACI|nr:hypothetical protein [Rossellomorea vietnamensis]TYS17578.1 hypothetical protein FZC78_06820 [Rossellomorea vietnamensis]
MSEEKRRVINADKVLIRANEVIILDENDKRKRHYDDVAGADEGRRHKRDRDDVGGQDDRRDDKRRGWSWI